MRWTVSRGHPFHTPGDLLVVPVDGDLTALTALGKVDAALARTIRRSGFEAKAESWLALPSSAVMLQPLAQYRDRERTLDGQCVPIECRKGRQQPREVASAMREQVGDGVVGQRKSPFPGECCQRRGLLGIGKRPHLVDQSPAEARAQILPQRPQDRSYSGDVGDALKAYANGKLGGAFKFEDMDRLYFMGGGCLVQRLREARHNALKEKFAKNPPATGSVYGAMQCMLKGVCSQCLQWQVDPATGQRTKAVFACSWQDQPLDMPDYDSLQERLAQNRLAEHISNLWLEHLFATHEIARV